MAIRKIATIPDPVLRRKARTVTKFDDKLQTLIDDMIETMRAAPGVGLAAPQVGVSERVIVIEYAEDENDEEAKPKLYVLINPEITRASTEKIEGTEGCLSIPMLYGDVDRHISLTVKGLNRRGQPVTIRAKDWLARIFQHEIDHLHGVVFTDLASKVWKPKPNEEFVDNV
jgi:peptide deformylase